MNITREEPAARQVVLKIQLDSSDVEPYLGRVYRRLVNTLQVPGFRKGKTPRSILENFMGKDSMVREGLDLIMPESVSRAISQEELQSFGEPEMELMEIDPITIKAVVPLEPVVELGEYGEIRQQPEAVDVTSEQVDAAVEQLRMAAGVWEPRQDQVRFDDLLTLDVDGFIDGKRVANDRGVQYIPKLDNPMPFPGFSVHLEGMKQDEAKEFTISVPEDHPDASIAGKDCRFNVKLLEIKEMKLPELDDEFAKGVEGGYGNLETLQAAVRGRLQEGAERDSRRNFQESILEQVLENAQVEFAPLTEERELGMLIDERARAMRQYHVDIDAHLRETGKTAEDIREELRPEAVRRLTRYLVLRKLGSNEAVEVKPEEVDAEIDRMVDASRANAEETRQTLSSESARRALTDAIYSRKALECLAEIAQADRPGDKLENMTASNPKISPKESGGGPDGG